jgi:4-diphosphocytidyl-2-C-methyl-D-erythritol kinase
LLHFPNAKINIGLYVTQKRDDGYHNLETIFYPLPRLKDALEILASPNEESSIIISGKNIDGDSKDNLVWKAYELIQKEFPHKVTPIQIRLLKAIPMGAGLGGGSADGAFMLRLLNQYFELNIDDKRLAEYALQLGSDCPFFIYNTPQMATGRGEVLEPISIDLSEYSIQLVCSKLHVSTAGAFSKISPKAAPINLSELNKVPIGEWKHIVQNDFEAPIFAANPTLEIIKQKLYSSGALYASMSGSGSAIYGIFEKGNCADILTNEFHEVYFFE